ncbi:DNA alkylation repair protein [Paenibacillus guangzhouensis]|uniref:DNA alkylation repair protein n=1 Tax=Paenibacillus guangzhouensis TaxID=1473112 RepID=UPI0012671A7E|nr:DNA alkylation repair protein [Paenibacillus guangzhouensis]
MAEPLKLVYNEAFLRDFGAKVKEAYDAFDVERFIADVIDSSWDELALKERMRKISETLGRYLPPSYEAKLDVLFAVDDGSCTGFPYLFMPDFIEVYGQAEEHWELSMQAMERFTRGSSAEFAIRPFILRDPERAMRQMTIWADHPNEHVRRLASEGCRPRLPWGVALAMFKRDPAPTLPILEKLQADPSLYVRKSVANNLNDIAKDHPSVVIETARRWQGKHPDTDWIIRHACRTLIRRADPEIMQIFGYAEDASSLTTSAELRVEPAALSIGERCELHYAMRVREGEEVRVRIEYGIYFVKAKGQTSRKLFLLSDKTVPGGSVLSGRRSHNWADLTTRRHYPGAHRVVLVVNGMEVAEAMVELQE